MKKTIVMAGSLLFLALFMTACGNKNTQETTAAVTEAATTAAVTSAASTAAEETQNAESSEKMTEAQSGEDEYGSLEGERYASADELNKKLGYEVLMLPESYGLKPSTIQCIPLEGESGYIGYMTKEGDADVYIDLYTVGKAESASVMQNEITMAEREVDGVKVTAGEGTEMFEGIRSARWSGSSQSYELITLGQSEEVFDSMLKDLLKVTMAQ